MAVVHIDGKWFDKNDAKISVYDHGLLYGDGLFEGIRIYNGVIFKLKVHLDRLFQGAGVLLIDIPMSRKELADMLLEGVRRFSDARRLGS
jgi:branched-chain amino acid aminotransferase